MSVPIHGRHGEVIAPPNSSIPDVTFENAVFPNRTIPKVTSGIGPLMPSTWSFRHPHHGSRLEIVNGEGCLR